MREPPREGASRAQVAAAGDGRAWLVARRRAPARRGVRRRPVAAGGGGGRRGVSHLHGGAMAAEFAAVVESVAAGRLVERLVDRDVDPEIPGERRTEIAVSHAIRLAISRGTARVDTASRRHVLISRVPATLISRVPLPARWVLRRIRMAGRAREDDDDDDVERARARAPGASPH